jgi:membrane protein
MKLKNFVKEVYQIWITERPVQLAAALAYYSMFSFAPVIFVAFSIVGFFLEDIDLMSQFFQRLENAFGAEISSLVQDSVMALSKTPSSSSVLVSIISFLALVYAASGVFYQLQFTLNKIWQVPPPIKGTTISTVRRRCSHLRS